MPMFLKAFPTMFWTLLFLVILPTASAIPNEAAFPDISFRTFNTLVQEIFSSDVSLATVLMVLFTLTNNPTLLSLHARQQNPVAQLGERKSKITGWIKALAHALHNKLEDQIYTLQRDDEKDAEDSNSALINSVGRKLDQFSKQLDLYPYNSRGKFQEKLKSISHAEIQPVLVICPDSIECKEISCDPRAVHQITRTRDIPKVTLVKGSDIYQNVPVLTGQCGKCKTLYSADNETLSEAVSEDETRNRRIYLNSAKYIEVGQSIWVDRVFSNAVVNSMYSFHASASAYKEYWNNSFGMNKSFKLGRRLVATYGKHLFKSLHEL
jgi:CxC5 like cysteine cluster associated with KDZ transposases